MNNNAVFMNYVVTGLVVLSLCYQLFQGDLMPLGSFIGQMFVFVTPLVTVWALKAPSNLSRRTALSANILIIVLVVVAAGLGLSAGVDAGAIVAMTVLFIPFPINVFILVRMQHVPSGA